MRKTHTGGTAAPAAVLPAVFLLMMLAVSLSPIGLMGCSPDGGDGSEGLGTPPGDPPPGVDTPTAEPVDGLIQPMGRIILICATEGAVIRYTTDGSKPTASNGDVYYPIAAIKPPELPCTVKAYAVKEGMTDSSVLVVSFRSAGGTGVTSDTVVTTLAGSTGGYADAQGTKAQFYDPGGIALDGTGNLYVADSRNNRIRKIVIETGQVSTIAGSTQGSANGQGTKAQFWNPSGIAVDGSENLYVTDFSNNRICKIDSLGQVNTLAGSTEGDADGTGGDARFWGPSGITIDGTGENLYVTDTYNHLIRKIVIATGEVITIAGSSADKEDNGDPKGGYDDGPALTKARFNRPNGITIDSSNANLYVTDYNNNRIRKIVIATGKEGVVSTLAGSGVRGTADGKGTDAQFWGPSGITIDGSGKNLSVTDSTSGLIRKIVIAAEVVVTTLYGNGQIDATGKTLSFSFPGGIAVDANGNLYVADSGHHLIRKIGPKGSAL